MRSAEVVAGAIASGRVTRHDGELVLGFIAMHGREDLDVAATWSRSTYFRRLALVRGLGLERELDDLERQADRRRRLRPAA